MARSAKIPGRRYLAGRRLRILDLRLEKARAAKAVRPELG
jgi:hypothetical protein